MSAPPTLSAAGRGQSEDDDDDDDDDEVDEDEGVDEPDDGVDAVLSVFEVLALSPSPDDFAEVDAVRVDEPLLSVL
jgi:hypothetical protein